MLNKLMGLLVKRKGLDKAMPKHIALTTEGKTLWARKNNKSLDEAYQKSFSVIFDVLKALVRHDVPIITIYLLPYRIEESGQLPGIIDNLVKFFDDLPGNEVIHKNKIRVSIWGKWYELPDRIIEPIKKVIDSTKDYDNFFLNFCVNYNGREEILDACRLIARKVRADKLEPELIDKGLFKDNLYSSSFLPVNLIIKSGDKRIPDLLLWDSAKSRIFFTEKSFLELGGGDISKALEFFKNKK
tara:strand:- start:9432 stop:10157 length:726 start_codon:yes stop_codon:yes gene_type:complete